MVVGTPLIAEVPIQVNSAGCPFSTIRILSVLSVHTTPFWGYSLVINVTIGVNTRYEPQLAVIKNLSGQFFYTIVFAKVMNKIDEIHHT